MPFEHSVRQVVVYETEAGEFSALCPFSGLPDYGTIRIEYVPKSWVLELKSLKYYLMSWRQIGVTQEDVTAYIFQDLKANIRDAEYFTVKTVYNVRGGINTTCVIDSREQVSKSGSL
jgi:7-cyano-7-deazaguanine reductase